MLITKEQLLLLRTLYFMLVLNILTRFHFTHSEVEKGSIMLNYVPSEHNVADIFTKAASKQQLDKFVVIRGMS